MASRSWNSRAAAVLAAVLLSGVWSGGAAEAQLTRKGRRESNANRRDRIRRAIESTYTHRNEASGGGGYLRFRSGPSQTTPGQDLQKNNEVTFYLNDTYHLNSKLGIVGGVEGAYGNAQIGNTIYNLQNPQISEYIFTAGPSYRFYTRQKEAISGFATGGVAYGKFDSGSKNIPPTLIGIYPAEWRAAFTVGASFDYNFYPNLAVRVSPMYVGTTFGGSVQSNYGFNLGLVYRFGRLK